MRNPTHLVVAVKPHYAHDCHTPPRHSTMPTTITMPLHTTTSQHHAHHHHHATTHHHVTAPRPPHHHATTHHHVTAPRPPPSPHHYVTTPPRLSSTVPTHECRHVTTHSHDDAALTMFARTTQRLPQPPTTMTMWLPTWSLQFTNNPPHTGRHRCNASRGCCVCCSRGAEDTP